MTVRSILMAAAGALAVMAAIPAAEAGGWRDDGPRWRGGYQGAPQWRGPPPRRQHYGRPYAYYPPPPVYYAPPPRHYGYGPPALYFGFGVR